MTINRLVLWIQILLAGGAIGAAIFYDVAGDDPHACGFIAFGAMIAMCAMMWHAENEEDERRARRRR